MIQQVFENMLKAEGVVIVYPEMHNTELSYQILHSYAFGEQEGTFAGFSASTQQEFQEFLQNTIKTQEAVIASVRKAGQLKMAEMHKQFKQKNENMIGKPFYLGATISKTKTPHRRLKRGENLK